MSLPCVKPAAPSLVRSPDVAPVSGRAWARYQVRVEVGCGHRLVVGRSPVPLGRRGAGHDVRDSGWIGDPPPDARPHPRWQCRDICLYLRPLRQRHIDNCHLVRVRLEPAGDPAGDLGWCRAAGLDVQGTRPCRIGGQGVDPQDLFPAGDRRGRNRTRSGRVSAHYCAGRHRLRLYRVVELVRLRRAGTRTCASRRTGGSSRPGAGRRPGGRLLRAWCARTAG